MRPVSDTPPAITERYRAMLLARSGSERLKMGCSMGATSRALIRASVLARDPHASPADLRRAIFLQFYGHEFGAGARERMLAWLGLDVNAPAAASRRVPVNWDDLEMALTMNPGEWTCYLDLRTGEVHLLAAYAGDREEGLSEAEIEAGLEAGHLVGIEPLDPSVEYGWMVAFTETVGQRRVRERLDDALTGRRPFRRFKDVLGDTPAERERWFAFRDEKLRQAVRDWLAGEGIEPTTTPPRRVT
jgi:Uncharacterised protein family (UPF0158)